MRQKIIMARSEKKLKTAVLILGGVQTLSMLVYGIACIVIETIVNGGGDWLDASVRSCFSLFIFDFNISNATVIAMNILFVLVLEGALAYLLFLRPFFLRAFDKVQIAVTVTEGLIATTSLLNMIGYSTDILLMLYFALHLMLAVAVNIVYKLASDNESGSKSVIISEA